MKVTEYRQNSDKLSIYKMIDVRAFITDWNYIR